jgi:hypothetical protein
MIAFRRGTVRHLGLALVCFGMGSSAAHAMGRAPRLDLRAMNVEHVYRLGHPIGFDLELRNRGNVPQTVVIWDEASIDAQPAVSLVFVVSRRSDGASFRIFPARDGSVMTNAANLPHETLDPGKFRRVRMTWENAGRWNWLREGEWAQMQLTDTYKARSDVLAGCFDQPELYDVRAVITVQMHGAAANEGDVGPPWKGRLVSIPFTILVQR